IAIVEYTSNDSEQMKAKAEIINKIFLNNSFNDQVLKQLWTETHEYRQSFIKQHTIADIREQFSVYSNPSMVLEDVKILTSVDLDNSVKERMDVLSNTQDTNSWFGCLKKFMYGRKKFVILMQKTNSWSGFIALID
ncbi:unnamed protein product, partial [Rotaria magnacalcarata]